jgi:uncharacterized protein YndB with AHSA1/START domain
MRESIIAKASVTINASAAEVWKALTTPEIMKQYFFGADVITDWKVGSPIVYKGQWEGKPYKDKGRIVKFEPEQILATTHWSPLSGVPDLPENYHTITYELSERSGKTRLTLTQDNNASEEERDQSAQMWNMVLGGLKKLLEA